MGKTKTPDITNFFVAGINYKKTAASARGLFAIGTEQYERLLSFAPSLGLQDIFVLSTCNRTEVYGFAEDPNILITWLCSETVGKEEAFLTLCYTLQGIQAIQHLYQVGAGLDSQILGDYEIIGQLKKAVLFSRTRGFIGAFLERLVNSVLQSSKSIKNQTTLSSGTVSVSFAAVQYIKQTMARPDEKKILLLGTGKIGRSTCRNLIDYIPTRNITLINRSDEAARLMAKELKVSSATFDQLSVCVQGADIIFVSTNAVEPVILKSHLVLSGTKLIIDLSIPYNVELGAGALPGITVINVDQLSKCKDDTLQKRQLEIPRAKAIVEQHLLEFLDWCNMRRHVPVLNHLRTKLQEMQSSPSSTCTLALPRAPLFTTREGEDKIQQIVNGMASKMRRHNRKGCHYLEAINEFMTSATN